MFASAAVLESEDFEGSSLWTGVTAAEYGKETPVALQYPFTATNKTYGVLDDVATSPEAEGATCFDMYVQFKPLTEEAKLADGAKLAVYADLDGGVHVLTPGNDYTTDGSVDTNTWARLTIVAESNGYKVYVGGKEGLLAADGIDDNNIFPAAPGAKTVEFTGSGKLDNFVARTTNPFYTGNYAASVGTGADNEKYATYSDALADVLSSGATDAITIAGETPKTVNGTAANPYEITNLADLQALADAVNAGNTCSGKCFVQTANIDMSEAGAFAGIGVYNATPTDGKPFAGTYDGGNFKISNVTMTARNYGGIFNQVNGGTIKNLTVENISTAATSPSEFGYAIVGNAGNGATLENLTAAGSFLSSEKPGTHNMAGIVVRACGGGTNGTLIKNCTNNATVYGAYTKMAGICAIAQHKVDGGPVTFDGCSNTGTLAMPSGSKAGRDGLAGIIGYVNDDTVLKGCSNTGTMTSTLETAKVGQLVGWAYNSVLTFEDAGTIAANGPAKIGDFGSTNVLDWVISGDPGKGFDFNVYGKEGTTVEIAKDFTGFPPQNADIKPTLKLSANMTINNGWQNITNATFTAISGTGTLTASHTYDYVKFYRIKKLDGFTGTLASGQPRVYFVIDDIVAAETPAYGKAVVKGGSSLKVYDLASTTLGGVAADLCVDTLDNQNGIYLAAAQVVADDESTTGYASVANALDAADAAFASTVNVLDANAKEVPATGWSYANGVYTSTREVATLNDTSYPSLAKALAAAKSGDTVTLVAASPEAVTIPAGVTVVVTDNVAFNGTVAGAGAVKYTAAQTGTIKFGEWTGTVTLDWAGIVNAGDIAPVVSKYGKAGSTVEIGPNGTISGASYFNTDPVATLKVSGFVSIDNGSSSTERTLPTVTGDGVLVFGSSGGRVNYRITNLVEWNGVVTNSSAAVGIANVTSGSGKIVFASTPDIAPTIGEGFTGEVYLNFNYSNYNIALYGGVNATRYLGTMSGHLHDGAGETGQTGEIPGKTVVSGAVAINNGWPIGSANWTAAKVVKFDSLKVDGSLTLDSTTTGFGTARCYYYAKSLDAAGVGTITVGDGFGLRIDAVDFAEAPSGSDVLVRLTLAKADLLTTDGQLFGTGGKSDGSIAVTVNGEATEQTLVYDADKGGLVLYVAPTYAATDSTGRGYTTVADAIATVYSLYPAQGSVVNVLDEEFTDAGTWNDYFTWNSETRVYTLREFVAAIGTTKYATLAKALEEAVGGDTIQLLADITLGAGDGAIVFPATKTLSLNLNGHVIQRLANSYYVLDIPSGAEVTILDSTGTTGMVKGTPVASGNTKNPASMIRLKGKLTLASGSLVSDYCCVKVDEDPGVGEFVMNGGSLEIIANDQGYTGLTFTIMNWGVATLNGGTHKGNVQSLSDSRNNASKSSTLTINGGSFDPANVYLIPYDTTYAPTVKIVSTIDNLTVVNAGKASLNWEVKNLADETVADKTYKVYSLSQIPQGFPGGEDGKTFTIDGEVTLPAGKALTDTASAATGLTYAQAAVLGLLNEEGALKKDVTPTIEVKNGKVVVSLDGTAVDATRYTVMLNVYESAAPIAASAETGWTLKKTYQLGDAEAAGFEPGSAVSGFYKVGVTIEDAAE